MVQAKNKWGLIARICVALPGLIICYMLAADAMRDGVSRALSTSSIIQSRVEPANRAVALSGSDPEAHYTRALALVNLQRLDEALAELREATRLRPSHYYEWLDLGVTLDRLGDREGAEQALRKSISLAPSFAQPHWQLGNFLYRTGNYPEAFEELRRGASGNPNLMRSLLPLAWLAANEDVGPFLSLARPENKRAYLEVSRFLAAQGKGVEAAEQGRQGGPPSSDEERRIVRETIAQLIALQQLSPALDLWNLSHPNTVTREGQIFNGEFLEPIVRSDYGFGWELPNIPNTAATVAPAGPSQGSRSLCIQFTGESAPASRLVNQLVLVKPGQRYTLQFMARTEGLVTGGPPLVFVLAPTNPEKTLGKSNPLPVGTNGWNAYQVDFWADEKAPGIVISLQRQQCAQSTCPIFGNLWLSKFTLSRS